MGPLDGIRVVDISHHMAGPMCSQKLGDMGADVVKVEPPQTGEWTRQRAINDLWVGPLNTSFLSLNRNKRSIELNLKAEADLATLHRLVASADVFLTNFRPGTAARLQVDYDALRQVNPSVVYCAVSGYGERGPGANRPGQDLLVQAYSGMTWNAGGRDDPPIPAGAFVCDAATGSMAVIGILAALLHRERTGEGQKVEVNLLGAALDVQIQEFTTYLNSGWLPERSRTRAAHAFTPAPYGIFETADGYLALAMGPLAGMAAALDAPGLAELDAPNALYRHRDEIQTLVAERLRTATTREWLARLDEHRLWASPVHTYADVAQDPQVIENDMIWRSDDEVGHVEYLGLPIRFSATPAALRRRPPLLGEHTAEIVAELGEEAQTP